MKILYILIIIIQAFSVYPSLACPEIGRPESALGPNPFGDNMGPKKTKQKLKFVLIVINICQKLPGLKNATSSPALHFLKT